MDIKEEIREVCMLAGIEGVVGTDKCLKEYEIGGACKKECRYFRDCSFYVTMMIDYILFELEPESFPDGYEVHIARSIQMFEAGIDVEPKERKGI